MAAITSELGRDQFMRLLVTQLQNQDPLEPVGQQEFIQQLSQFSMLEGIENLNASFGSWMKLQQISQGAQMTGRTVEYIDASGQKHEGVVQAASVKDGVLTLRIDDQDVPIENVTAVLDPLST
jgi:flagellar basal-body rod modification protein FlgD